MITDVFVLDEQDAIGVFVQDEQTAVDVTDQTIIIRGNTGEGYKDVFLRISNGYFQYSTDNKEWNNLATVQNGKDGATFTPAVSSDGVIGWSNDKGLPNPQPVNINGKQGDPGYTPQKGTDYWTEADIAQIKSYVDEAILGGEW